MRASRRVQTCHALANKRLKACHQATAAVSLKHGMIRLFVIVAEFADLFEPFSTPCQEYIQQFGCIADAPRAP